MTNTVRPGLYRHFKGNLYRVTKVARHSENEEEMVVYQALYGEKGWWVRPLSMFDEWIERGGERMRRFARCDEQTLTLEMVVLNVRAGQSSEFEATFHEAQKIIQGARGYLGHELRRCEENSGQYLFLVDWKTLEHHTQGFRDSQAYEKWRKLLHRFYAPTPMVEHYLMPLSQG